MSSGTVAVAGLAAGLVAGSLLLAALVLAPAAVAPAGPAGTATATGSTPAPPASAPAGTEPAASGAAATAPGGGDLAGLFRVGEPAPALDLPRAGGGRVSLAELRGRPVWVTFMATWCPSCRDELPRMSAYSLRLADEGLAVLAVDVREDEPTVLAYARDVGVVFPVALDLDGAAQRAWGALGLPVHYWIDAEGIVRFGALGGIGPDLMAEGLRRILPGVAIEP